MVTDKNKKMMIVGAVLVVVVIVGIGFFYPHFAAAGNTKYADKYNDATFKNITIGTSGDSVQGKLGSPLQRETRGNTTYLHYSQAATGSGYFDDRTIVEQKNMVTEIISTISRQTSN